MTSELPPINSPLRVRQGRPGAGERAIIDRRRAEVGVLLVARYRARQIGELLDVPYETVKDDIRQVRKAWRERAAEAYGDHVGEQVATIDTLMSAYVTKALEGDKESALIVFRCLDRKAKLLGLDQPARLESVVSVQVATPLDEAIEELLSQFPKSDTADTGMET